MAVRLLQETLTFAQSKIELLHEDDGQGKNLYLKGICIEGDKVNANERVYPLKEIARAVDTINEQISNWKL